MCVLSKLRAAELHQPLKVIVDSRLELPLDARLLRDGGVLIAAAADDCGRSAALTERGAEVMLLPGPGGQVDLVALLQRTGTARHQRSARRGRFRAQRFAVAGRAWSTNCCFTWRHA
jgi:riboflavin biosynthesis pyrimidine reductase